MVFDTCHVRVKAALWVGLAPAGLTRLTEGNSRQVSMPDAFTDAEANAVVRYDANNDGASARRSTSDPCATTTSPDLSTPRCFWSPWPRSEALTEVRRNCPNENAPREPAEHPFASISGESPASTGYAGRAEFDR